MTSPNKDNSDIEETARGAENESPAPSPQEPAVEPAPEAAPEAVTGQAAPEPATGESEAEPTTPHQPAAAESEEAAEAQLDGESAAARPEGEPATVRPEGEPATVRPEGEPAATQPAPQPAPQAAAAREAGESVVVQEGLPAAGETASGQGAAARTRTVPRGAFGVVLTTLIIIALFGWLVASMQSGSGRIGAPSWADWNGKSAEVVQTIKHQGGSGGSSRVTMISQEQLALFADDKSTVAYSTENGSEVWTSSNIYTLCRYAAPQRLWCGKADPKISSYYGDNATSDFALVDTTNGKEISDYPGYVVSPSWRASYGTDPLPSVIANYNDDKTINASLIRPDTNKAVKLDVSSVPQQSSLIVFPTTLDWHGVGVVGYGTTSAIGWFTVDLDTGKKIKDLEMPTTEVKSPASVGMQVLTSDGLWMGGYDMLVTPSGDLKKGADFPALSSVSVSMYQADQLPSVDRVSKDLQTFIDHGKKLGSSFQPLYAIITYGSDGPVIGGVYSDDSALILPNGKIIEPANYRAVEGDVLFTVENTGDSTKDGKKDSSKDSAAKQSLPTYRTVATGMDDSGDSLVFNGAFVDSSTDSVITSDGTNFYLYLVR